MPDWLFTFRKMLRAEFLRTAICGYDTPAFPLFQPAQRRDLISKAVAESQERIRQSLARMETPWQAFSPRQEDATEAALLSAVHIARRDFEAGTQTDSGRSSGVAGR